MAKVTLAIKWQSQELIPGMHDSKATALSTTHVTVEE